MGWNFTPQRRPRQRRLCILLLSSDPVIWIWIVCCVAIIAVNLVNRSALPSWPDKQARTVHLGSTARPAGGGTFPSQAVDLPRSWSRGHGRDLVPCILEQPVLIQRSALVYFKGLLGLNAVQSSMLYFKAVCVRLNGSVESGAKFSHHTGCLARET
jgi:hypothetical protein